MFWSWASHSLTTHTHPKKSEGVKLKFAEDK